jgi:hypothetical protein
MMVLLVTLHDLFAVSLYVSLSHGNCSTLEESMEADPVTLIAGI